jgi:SPP1 gp7 family putative phage head morphogenesis protein
MNFFFEPAPAKDVAAFIRGKAPLTRAQFDQMLPELRALSFTVAGVTAANALQDLRDTIATLPEGALFKDVQKALAKKLGDHVEDPPPELFEESEEDKAARMEKLENQARFILRQNGNQAYAVAAHKDLAENRDIFPYWKYLTVGDDHVRDSHRALEGITLPADDPFWHHHYPPWEYNCRCQVVPVTDREYQILQDEDKDKPIEERSTLDPKMKELLDTERALYRNVAGVPTKIDLRAPVEKPHQGDNVYVFDPRQFQIPLESLKDRYDPEVWDGFVKFAKNTEVEGAGNLWKWLNKRVSSPRPKPRPVAKPAPMPPAPQPAPASVIAAARSADHVHAAVLAHADTFSARVDAADKRANQIMNEAIEAWRAMVRLAPESPERRAAEEKRQRLLDEHKSVFQELAALRIRRQEAMWKELEEHPANRASITVNAGPSLVKLAQDAADIIERMVHRDLVPKVNAVFRYKRGRAQYSHRRGAIEIENASGVRTAVHELGHWIEMNMPDVLKQLIAFRTRRTAGETPQSLRKLTGKPYGRDEIALPDKFTEMYAGKVYRTPYGVDFASEILSIGLEQYLYETAEFAKKDPDYFKFIHDLIHNLKPTTTTPLP